MWQALETKARFISQVMTGDCTTRRAEDIGSQELSYAEVKAIASGNPAVLTLAEADAELQRLAVLRKNHADEQFLARRNLRDLPEVIDRQRKRVADLTSDLETLATHADDPITIGARPCRRDDVQAVLAHRLEELPEVVKQTRRVPLGVFRGLRFGIVIHPQCASEIYVEGESVRHASLSREHQGPRAVMNAVERVASGTESHCATARNDLALSQGQLRDYEARLGKPFPHSDYQAALMELRDRLKVALSATTSESGTDSALNPQDLTDRIRALKDSHTLDSPPQLPRLSTRSPTAERPVTARIRDRKEAFAVEPSDEAEEELTTEMPVAVQLDQVPETPLAALVLPAAPAEFWVVHREAGTIEQGRQTQRRMF
jgi:hypothetical protein